MSGSIIKIKRRASTGLAGAPSSLKAGELAFNENASDKILYYGYESAQDLVGEMPAR